MGKIQSLKIFKISGTFNLPDLWGLPSWYLDLSVRKKFRYIVKSLQVHVTTLYINELISLIGDVLDQKRFNSHYMGPVAYSGGGGGAQGAGAPPKA